MGKLVAIALQAGAAMTLGACAGSHVKGSWACAVEPGTVCASIHDIDSAKEEPSGRREHRGLASNPIIDGAIPARLAGGGGWTAGALAGAPGREPDPTVKVAIAPWIDGVGDYHSQSEIYAVMRHGAWVSRPAKLMRRVELTGGPLANRNTPDSPSAAPAAQHRTS